ncbi:MAG: ribosome assembly cofactor RimP [Cytophagales bacterium CG12_big_fil_rev_8_21_14_0_65_40_12]|nr:MAG: ribosome assembly cofactor RimP [Cytophagales bacterium CG12_big_fil_rev_8_21_14_0_65_40_12]PIW04088.1 MAG: ribosome assembly cofactor RimP [Cytophagales bacterium CG17_big_fil_post_rev_8_21_14_2_50_40_13]
MDIKDFVEKAALESLKDESYFIVDVLVKGLTSKAKILVLLDSDNGVNIDECADLSRAIGMKMELEEVFDDPFVLEVSSPGLDHPLKFKRQYQKNVGRELKLVMLDGTIEKGKLIEVGETSIKFEKEIKEKKKTTTELVEIAFDSIDKANVLVSFK